MNLSAVSFVVLCLFVGMFYHLILLLLNFSKFCVRIKLLCDDVLGGDLACFG